MLPKPGSSRSPIVTRVDPQVLDECLAQPSFDFSEPTEAELARRELGDRLMQVATEEQREALRLRLAGLPYSEVAKLLGISIRSVRGREARGLEKIRAAVAASPELFQLP